MGQLILFFVLKGLLVHLFPVCLQFAIGSFRLPKTERKPDDRLAGRQAKKLPKKVSYLEDFDLAAGRMDMLHVLPLFIGGKSVHLDTEGHPFLAPMLPGGELGADAVDLGRWGRRQLQICCACCVYDPPDLLTWVDHYLDEDRSILDWIPEKLNGVEMQRVWTGLEYPHRQRDICQWVKSQTNLSKSTSGFNWWRQISSFGSKNILKISRELIWLVLWAGTTKFTKEIDADKRKQTCLQINALNIVRASCGSVSSPISKIRSPGLFHLQPSICWCSIYCSRRSWNTTRTMLCEQAGSGD